MNLTDATPYSLAVANRVTRRARIQIHPIELKLIATGNIENETVSAYRRATISNAIWICMAKCRFAMMGYGGQRSRLPFS